MENCIEKFKSWFELTLRHPALKDWKREAEEDLAFYDGDQFSQEEIAELDERGQPIIEVNKVQPKMNNLMGAHASMPARHVAKARSEDSTESAEAITDVFRYIDYRSGYYDEEADMFQDGVLAGLGWMEAVESIDEDGQDEVLFKYEETLNMRADPFGRSQDLDADYRFCSRDKWMYLEDAQEMFPDKAAILTQAVVQSEDVFESVAHRGPNDDYDMKDDSVSYVDIKKSRVRIVELWYKHTEKVMFTEDNRYLAKEDLNFYRGPDDEFKDDEIIMADNNIRSATLKVCRKVFFTGDHILQESITPFNHPLLITKFPLFIFVCFRKKSGERKGEPYGYVRNMKPMQREINKRRSKAMHLLNTTKVIMDEGAVEDVDELRDEAARPDAIIAKKKGFDLVLDEGAQLANSQFSIMEKSSQDLQEISGIFDESIGSATNARSGKAIGKRIRASNQNNIKVFSNLRRTRRKIGAFKLGVVKQYFNEERILYITNEDSLNEPKKIELNKPEDGRVKNSIKEALVRMVIDDAPASATTQEEQFDELVELARGGFPIPPKAIIMASNIRNKDEILKLMSVNPPNGDGTDGASNG